MFVTGRDIHKQIYSEAARMDAQDGAGPAAPPLGARGRMLMKTLWDHRRRWIQAGNTGLSRNSGAGMA